MLSYGRRDVLFVLHQKKEYEKRIECQFEAFCKKVLRNEARKCYRELKRQRGREISLEEIVVNHVQLLHYKLDFPVGHDFLAFGVPITIHDERLADKLMQLDQKYREIILMAYCLGMSDREIGNEMRIPRRTIARYRNKTLNWLKEFLESRENSE